MKTEPKGWLAFDLADRHRRAFFVERESMRQLAGWFLKSQAWELKHELGYRYFTDSEHADWLHDRLQNLRGGNPRASIEPGLMRAISANLNAPSEAAFLRGLFLTIKPRLLAFYRQTMDHADPSANAFDIRMVRRIIPELEEQISWAESVRVGTDDTQAESWAASIDALIEQAGGIDGQADGSSAASASLPGEPFALPQEIVFDQRIGSEPIMGHEQKVQLPYEQALVEQFRVFFNEIYAASILATVVHEAFDHDVPWSMIRWFSRHFWDEVRHSQFGAVRLQELGKQPDRCDQTLFKRARQMPFMHRICYLTLVLEKHYMPRKKPRFEEYGNAGDLRSQLFADGDWSDEMNHVRNGRRWLETLLEDDARDVSDIEDETTKLLERITGESVTTVSPF